MERRVLLAIFLAFIVLYLWQAFFAPPLPEPLTQPPPPTATTAAPAPAAAPAAPAAAPSTPHVPVAEALIGDTIEKDIRIETLDVVAVFTNRGGRLKSWRLKRYLDPDGEPLELVTTELADSHPLPFSLRTTDDAVTGTLNGALYTVRGTPPESGVISSPAEVVFEYRNTAGLHALKEFRLEPSSYLVGFQTTVTQNDRVLPRTVLWGPAVGNAIGETSSYAMKAAGVYFMNGEVERLDPADIASQPAREGAFGYVGVDDHYFLIAVLEPGSSTITYQPVSIPPPAGSTGAVRELVSFAIDRSLSDAPARFFIGPKDFDVLAAVDRDLVRVINFGIFSIIVVPLLRTLNWIHGFVGNYGWSIIILTVILNALMFPLRHKSVVSMRKMQEIQPEAKAIQERYAKLKATDPAKQKMNQELMGLYRERGVNPASGCVPMLLTMPVLFALYSLLTVAIELRGAPFMLWIHDLSLPDPYFVIPVLMGASQFWQQWLAPQTGMDPTQQKMMMFMPVIMMVFFLWMPAGVALYLFVSNVWGIGQQSLTNYLIGPPNVRNVRPPAERRVKRVESAKTTAVAGEN